ncbi:hypothetical protein Goklo_025098, partial [Gossypium klotzschianum]|nr:hypothetical protein [Gossypium klotzschianum]
MVACTYPHYGIVDAFVAEAQACEQAINFMVDLGFRLVQVEGDSLTVIKKLNSATPYKSILSSIIKYINKKFGRKGIVFNGRDTRWRKPHRVIFNDNMGWCWGELLTGFSSELNEARK